MSGIRRERVIDEKQRQHVVRCWYALHLVAFIAVIVGLLINNGPPVDLGTAMGFGLWLGTFVTASILLVTVGLMGVYERTSPVVLTKAIAAGLAALTGLPLYGLGLVSTPILVVIGVLLRLAIIGVQRFLGLHLAPESLDRDTAQSGCGEADSTSALPTDAPAPGRRASPRRLAVFIAAFLVLVVVGGGVAIGRAVVLPDSGDQASLQVSVVSYSVDRSDAPVVMGRRMVDQRVQIKVVNTSSQAVTLRPLTDIGMSGAGAGDPAPPNAVLSAAANPDPGVVREVRLARRESATFTLIYTTLLYEDFTDLEVTVNGSTFSTKL